MELLPFDITLIDTGFVREHLAASYLIRDGGAAAFVETGPANGLPRLLAALEEHQIPRSAVAYVIVTHVHLDHAGGAGALMRELPNAKLVVHPRGARHLVDPARLLAGATEVYGEEKLRRMFGPMVPVAQDRVILAEDGLRMSVGGRELEVMDTPGHALHHVVVLDHRSRGFFSGDMFGLRYPELAGSQGPLVFPTTTPVQFDPSAMHASIDRMMARRPERIYFTHFGCQEGPTAPMAADLHRLTDAYVEIARASAAEPNRHEAILSRMAELLARELDRKGYHGSARERRALLDLDLELNAQGLESWLDRVARS